MKKHGYLRLFQMKTKIMCLHQGEAGPQQRDSEDVKRNQVIKVALIQIHIDTNKCPSTLVVYLSD